MVKDVEGSGRLLEKHHTARYCLEVCVYLWLSANVAAAPVTCFELFVNLCFNGKNDWPSYGTDYLTVLS